MAATPTVRRAHSFDSYDSLDNLESRRPRHPNQLRFLSLRAKFERQPPTEAPPPLPQQRSSLSTALRRNSDHLHAQVPTLQGQNTNSSYYTTETSQSYERENREKCNYSTTRYKTTYELTPQISKPVANKRNFIENTTELYTSEEANGIIPTSSFRHPSLSSQSKFLVNNIYKEEKKLGHLRTTETTEDTPHYLREIRPIMQCSSSPMNFSTHTPSLWTSNFTNGSSTCKYASESSKSSDEQRDYKGSAQHDFMDVKPPANEPLAQKTLVDNVGYGQPTHFQDVSHHNFKVHNKDANEPRAEKKLVDNLRYKQPTYFQDVSLSHFKEHHKNGLEPISLSSVLNNTHTPIPLPRSKSFQSSKTVPKSFPVYRQQIEKREWKPVVPFNPETSKLSDLHITNFIPYLSKSNREHEVTLKPWDNTDHAHTALDKQRRISTGSMPDQNVWRSHRSNKPVRALVQKFSNV